MSLKSYVIFIRHGHRAPSKNIFNDSNEIKELNFWKALLPPNSLINSFNKKFPIIKYIDNPVPKDDVESSSPFGKITNKGVSDIVNTGYDFIEYFPSLLSIIKLSPTLSNIHISATNYCRTQVKIYNIIS
jgi:hypothetical protein